MLDRDKFAVIKAERIWAIGSINGTVHRLSALHRALAARIGARDGVVYLGNYIGIGSTVRETLDELLRFRCWLLSRPTSFAADVAFLRGAQEQMWHKLLQLQFARDPADVLGWLLEHGITPTLEAYGGTKEQGFAALREGIVATTRWTAGLRERLNACPGHTPFFSNLRRAAVNGRSTLLFVHAGIDLTKDLADQSDALWWGAGSFDDIDQSYQGFTKLVRGHDLRHRGVTETALTLTLDAGSGLGGTLLAACLAPDGTILDMIEA